MSDVCGCVIVGHLVTWMQWLPVRQTLWFTPLCRMDQFDKAVAGAGFLCLLDVDTVCRFCLLCTMPRVSRFMSISLLSASLAICPSLIHYATNSQCIIIIIF